MSLFTFLNNKYMILIYILLINLFLKGCVSFKQSITLDTKLKVQDDDIERISKFKKWTTFKVRDPVNKRIGVVKHGSIVMMDDVSEDIVERTVYFKPLKRASERYMIKILTKYKDYPHTVEFIIEDNNDSKTCMKVFRDQIDVDISRIDSSSIKSLSSPNGWMEYSIRNELNLQYRIGRVTDGSVVIVSDSEDTNVRLRYVHVSKRGFLDQLIGACLPCLPMTDPTVVRVFTYYHKGERSFDEFVETYRGRTKRYKELVKTSINLNLARSDSKYIKKFKLNLHTFVYTISDDFKNKNKIGNVLNNKIVIVNDDDNIRLRSVFINKEDTKFEHVEVKTCYNKGDCQRCKYILEDKKYSKTTCKTEKENPQDPGSSPNLFVSSDELDKINDKSEPYLNSVVSFSETTPSIYDIMVDISNPRSNYFTIDVLPLYGGLLYSLNKEHTGKNSRLKVFDGTNLITNIHLKKVKQVEFIIKLGKKGERRIFMWTKCGLELQKGHEVVVIDSLKRVSEYKTKKIDKGPSKIITTMIN